MDYSIATLTFLLLLTSYLNVVTISFGKFNQFSRGGKRRTQEKITDLPQM